MKLQQINTENDVERLIILRKRLNMKQYEFAKEVGVSTIYITNVETYRTPLTPLLVKKINVFLSKIESEELI